MLMTPKHNTANTACVTQTDMQWSKYVGPEGACPPERRRMAPRETSGKV